MRAIPMMMAPPIGGSLEDKVNWLMNIVPQIVDATQDDPETIADGYKIITPGPPIGFTPRRQMDFGTATPDEVREVLGTFILDWNKRGQNRGTG